MMAVDLPPGLYCSSKTRQESISVVLKGALEAPRQEKIFQGWLWSGKRKRNFPVAMHTKTMSMLSCLPKHRIWPETFTLQQENEKICSLFSSCSLRTAKTPHLCHHFCCLPPASEHTAKKTEIQTTQTPTHIYFRAYDCPIVRQTPSDFCRVLSSSLCEPLLRGEPLIHHPESNRFGLSWSKCLFLKIDLKNWFFFRRTQVSLHLLPFVPGNDLSSTYLIMCEVYVCVLRETVFSNCLRTRRRCWHFFRAALELTAANHVPDILDVNNICSFIHLSADLVHAEQITRASFHRYFCYFLHKLLRSIYATSVVVCEQNFADHCFPVMKGINRCDCCKKNFLLSPHPFTKERGMNTQIASRMRNYYLWC